MHSRKVGSQVAWAPSCQSRNVWSRRLRNLPQPGRHREPRALSLGHQRKRQQEKKAEALVMQDESAPDWANPRVCRHPAERVGGGCGLMRSAHVCDEGWRGHDCAHHTGLSRPRGCTGGHSAVTRAGTRCGARNVASAWGTSHAGGERQMMGGCRDGSNVNACFVECFADALSRSFGPPAVMRTRTQ